MNLIVIMADSFRADHLGCYGNTWINTPALDALAAESVLFEHAYTEGPITLPARLALFTGRYTFPFRGWAPLEESDLTICEILSRAGYTNIIVGDSGPLWDRGGNYAARFDVITHLRRSKPEWYVPGRNPQIDEEVRWYKELESRSPDIIASELNQIRHGAYLIGKTKWTPTVHSHAQRVVETAIKILEKHARPDNLFFWLDCFDPHEPWDPPPPYDTMYDKGYKGRKMINPPPSRSNYLTPDELEHVRALYAGAISNTDEWIGKFIDFLRSSGLLDQSLLVFISDHGEPLCEHGKMRKVRGSLYSPLLRIPFMIRHPSGEHAGKRVSALVQTPDFLPTVLGLIGAAPPVDIHGKYLWPLVDGTQSSVRPYAYCGYYQGDACIRDHDWSYVRSPDRSKEELYDLRADPEEQHNLAHVRPGKADHLRGELDSFMGDMLRAAGNKNT
jgi:arylsulfatase A-like enzyme